jgi:dTDP-glucose pyrophosphorylase/CBS domain-containing protein
MTSRDASNGVSQFDACRVSLGLPLLAVLQSLDASSLEIVLVEDEHGRARGVVTHGDVRRALLSGATLTSPVDGYVSTRFWFVSPGASRAEVLDLMQGRRIGAVPIVDADRRFVGLHALHELLGADPKPNWAVVMAGGRGERLRPLTDTIPKPMIKVAGRPILERLVLHLVGFGIQRLFISVNYRADLIEEHLGDGASLGCTIEYLREETPLGTGGALSLLPERPGHPLVVLNGDLLTQVDVARMLAFHDQGGYHATIGVHEYTHTVPYGVVDLDGDRVTQVREKPTDVWQVNAGIYVLDPDLIGRVPVATYFGLPTLIDECLEKGEPVGAFYVREEWMDVGQHHELKRARGED